MILVLGSANLRDFSFNELPSTSFIHTLHESSLGSMNDSVQQSDMNQFDDNEPVDDEHEPFSQEELVSAAIDDLNDDFSHTNEVFKHALTELSQPNPSSFHLSLGKSQSSQPLTQVGRQLSFESFLLFSIVCRVIFFRHHFSVQFLSPTKCQIC